MQCLWTIVVLAMIPVAAGDHALDRTVANAPSVRDLHLTDLRLHTANNSRNGIEGLPASSPNRLLSSGLGVHKPQVAKPSVDRLIEGYVVQTGQYLDAAVVLAIAKYAKVSIGLELLPTRPHVATLALPLQRQRSLTGLTVRDALDWLVELDNRYSWVESKEVVVIRPVDAWRDAEHFLNRIVKPFSVSNRDAAEVLWALGRAVDTGVLAWAVDPLPVRIPITMAVQAPTDMLEVLNELARSGSLFWMIHYERRPFLSGHAVRLEVGDVEQARRDGGAIWLRQPLPQWLR